MASAAPAFHSTKETTNYARLCRLLVDVGAHVLRETFDRKRPPGSLDIVLSSPPAHAKLQSLRKKRVLNPSQWAKLYPAIKTSVSSRNFDTTLLVILLRNICGLVPPATGWDNLPPVTDLTPEADIVRIKCYRNTVYGHASEASVDDATFNQYWQDIQVVLVRLGGTNYQDAIDDLKNECMDPDFEEHYQELLKQWVKDEVSIKDRLDEISEKLDDLKGSKKKKTTNEDVAIYTSGLKTSVKSQTEFQSKLMAYPTISGVRTDEIFTNLLIQRGRKPVDGHAMGRKQRLRQYGQVSETHRVNHCQEIFIPATGEKENPKSILLTGKAGIGKTLFSQKLIRDWADDKLFQDQTNAQIPDLKFAYLLTFRQLNLLGDEHTTLRELLNRSSVLDEHSNINEFLSQYIVNHSKEVLIVIDGYDEYKEQNYIASNLDEQYPNSDQEKMPIAALCAKLIKGKILRDSVVMITSRPDESDKMNRIHFDRYVEIAGFSKQQVREYIGKYFKGNERRKNIVLDHITKNENLVSFAHIPVLCVLMCAYMDCVLEGSLSHLLPVKTSDLYFKVVEKFLLDHNKKEVPTESTLDKLSELAAQWLLEKKFLFVVEDMKTLGFEEVQRLRASGLLHCGTPFRTSLNEVTKHFCFTHLTLHEYLAARGFVKRKEIPFAESVSSMVMQFMSGILSKSGKDHELMGQLMEKLLEALPSPRGSRNILLIAKCLIEYEDKQFAKNIIKKHPRYFVHEENISFSALTDADCIAVSFLLDTLSALNALNKEEADARHQTFSEQAYILKSLEISFSYLTQSGVRRMCNSLEKDTCAVTKLKLFDCQLDDECVDCIRGLVSSKLTELALSANLITDAGVVGLSEALQSSACQLTSLSLNYNQITDAGCVSLSQALQSSACQVTQVTSLHLSSNQITDAGVASLSQALQSSACQVTTLDLSCNEITDAGVVSLSQALQSSACQVTTLDLSENQITDAGVANLSQTLQSSVCQITTLYLSCNEITDAGVVSLSQALQSSACQVTTLDLSENQITDAGVDYLSQTLQLSACQVTTLYLSCSEITDAGVVSLSQALQSSACQITSLYLSTNKVTDAGVVSLSQALQSSACQVTSLYLSTNNITDVGVVSLSQALQLSACQVTTLDLSENQITAAGVVSLSQALQSSACQVTTLDLSENRITDAGVVSLSQALQSSACQVTTLDLSENQITDAGVVSLSQALQSPACRVASIDLRANQITDAGVVSLSQALHSPACQVTSLDLRDNEITDSGEKPLRNLEHKKPSLELNY